LGQTPVLKFGARRGERRYNIPAYFWHREHQTVVRPPIIAWRKGVRWRGQIPSRFHF